MPNGATKVSRRKSCEHPSCPKQPAFSYNGSGVRFCAQHRLEGMVNVRNRRCEGKDCTKEPYFGEKGGKARFCATHKPDESMVDVRHRRCEYESCTKQPNYGYEGQRACYCSTHKLESMVDVKHRRCAEPNCRGYSFYSFPGSKEKFCMEHKREGMVPSGRSRPSLIPGPGGDFKRIDSGGRKRNVGGPGNTATVMRTSSSISTVSSESPRSCEGTIAGSPISFSQPKGKPATFKMAQQRVGMRDVQDPRLNGPDDDWSSGEDDAGSRVRRGVKNPADDDRIGIEETRRLPKRRSSDVSSPEKPEDIRMLVDHPSDIKGGWQRGRSSSAEAKTGVNPWALAATQGRQKYLGDEHEGRRLQMATRPSSPSIPGGGRRRVYPPSSRPTDAIPRGMTVASEAGGDLVQHIPSLIRRAPLAGKPPTLDPLSREFFDGHEGGGGSGNRKANFRQEDDDNAASFRHDASLPLRNGFPQAPRHGSRAHGDTPDAPAVPYRNVSSGGNSSEDNGVEDARRRSGSSDARDSRGGGYPATLPPPLRQGYNAGGAPNMGFPRNKARNGGEDYGDESPAPAGGSGGGTWATVAIANPRLPDVALGKDQPCPTFNPGVPHHPRAAESPSARWRGPPEKRPSAASTGWPFAQGDGGNGGGGGLNVKSTRIGTGNSWTFPSARLTREPWPSPPLVNEDKQCANGSYWDEEQGGSSWAPRRCRTPPSERSSSSDSLSQVSRKNPSVVTLGPWKRLAKFERGSGSLGPTLEALDMSWARAPKDLRVVSGR